MVLVFLAAEMLQQKRLIEENVWSNPQMKTFAADGEKDEERIMPTPLTQTDIASGFRATGLAAGDVVLVHSAMRSFGAIADGQKTRDIGGELGTRAFTAVVRERLSSSLNVG